MYLSLLPWPCCSQFRPTLLRKPARSPAGEAISPDAAWTKLGQSLWFDARERRLYLKARVVLREGYLEHLMCLKGTKEHEAILSTDAVPSQIQAGLIATGADPGKPVQFVPKFEPPTGSAIAIEVRWMKDGKIQKQDASKWVKDREGQAARTGLGLRRQPAL